MSSKVQETHDLRDEKGKQSINMYRVQAPKALPIYLVLQTYTVEVLPPGPPKGIDRTRRGKDCEKKAERGRGTSGGYKS